MAKITVDDVEYDTDDFTDVQNNIVKELVYNSNVQTQLDYQSNSLKVSQQLLTAKLKETLETPAESE
jgi:lysyl-tRNA synthetase class II